MKKKNEYSQYLARTDETESDFYNRLLSDYKIPLSDPEKTGVFVTMDDGTIKPILESVNDLIPPINKSEELNFKKEELLLNCGGISSNMNFVAIAGDPQEETTFTLQYKDMIFDNQTGRNENISLSAA